MSVHTQEEFEAEKEELTDMVRELSRQIKLQNLLMEVFVPPSSFEIITRHSRFDEYNDEWVIDCIEFAGETRQDLSVRLSLCLSLCLCLSSLSLSLVSHVNRLGLLRLFPFPSLLSCTCFVSEKISPLFVSVFHYIFLRMALSCLLSCLGAITLFVS